MTDEPEISFTAGKSIRYKSEFSTAKAVHATVRPIFNERIRNLIESLFPAMPHKQDGWW